MVRLEDEQLDRFLTTRMLRYCRESGLNFYESVHALHIPNVESEEYELEWLEA